jgi:hypothetical protein
MRFFAFTFLLLLLTALSSAAQSPAAVEKDLLYALKQISDHGTYAGDYDEEKLDKANDALRDILVRNGRRLDILQYAFPGLKDEMDVATSKDGKLRIYSWDLQTGGTMHDYASVFQCQGNSGAVYSWIPKDDDESGGGYYTQIFQVSSKSGPVYLATSTSVAEGRLRSQSIQVVKINGDNLDTAAKLIRTKSGLQNSVGFAYDPSSLGDRSERLILFDAVKQTFRFPVVIEDSEYENGRVTNRFITYRFDGQYFVKVS